MLARLANTPANDLEWQRFGFDHLDSHDRIRAAILEKLGVSLSPQVIYPLPLSQMKVWLDNNSRLHIDMDGVLGVQSSDLLDVNFNDRAQLDAWTALHYLEHRTAEQILGIGG